MKDLFVVGWFEKGKNLVVCCEGGASTYPLNLRRAKEISDVIEGSKIYRLVEVNEKKKKKHIHKPYVFRIDGICLNAFGVIGSLSHIQVPSIK